VSQNLDNMSKVMLSPLQAIKVYEGEKVKLHSFLTSALDGLSDQFDVWAAI
jgi:hypothetical protein